MREEEHSHIYLIARNGSESRQITDGDGNDLYPIWSPDSQSIAFQSTRSGGVGLWRVPLAGGGPEFLMKVPQAVFTLVAWRKQPVGEMIYYADGQNLYALNLQSKNAEQVTKLSGSNSRFSLAPDSGRLLYQARKDNRFLLQLHTLSNGKEATLLSNENSFYSPTWFADGQHFAYCTNLSGSIQPHIYSFENRQTAPINFGETDYNSVAVAPDGKAILANSQNQNANIYSLDLDGNESSHTKQTGLHLFPSLSPDGSLLIYQSVSRSEKALIEKVPGGGGNIHQLAANPYSAQVSPDGQNIAFTRLQKGSSSLFLLPHAGKEESLLVDRISESGFFPLPYDLLYRNYNWTPDSQRLVYITQDSPETQNIWELSLADKSKKLLLPMGQLRLAISPLVSPDGQSVALVGKENVDPKKGNNFHLYWLKQEKLTSLYESRSILHVLGWSPATGAVIVAEGNRPDTRVGWQSITVLKCQPQLAQCQTIKVLPSAYLPSVCLAGNGQAIAFVSRANNASNINLLNLNTANVQQLTKNMEAGFYYSGLNWAPDSKQLFYSKQTNFEILTLFEFR